MYCLKLRLKKIVIHSGCQILVKHVYVIIYACGFSARTPLRLNLIHLFFTQAGAIVIENLLRMVKLVRFSSICLQMTFFDILQ